QTFTMRRVETGGDATTAERQPVLTQVF
ncbi:MAG: hypothetical protein QOE80_4385, partial [Actinomycetota bacterium]|nr:hypothetical protein [Actinomycetota bacterium]